MDEKKIKSPLGEIPNPFAIHDGLFTNVNEAKYAIRGVLRAYFGNDSDDEDDYLFFKSAVVRFEKEPTVDLSLDHRRRIIIFIFKEPKGKNSEKIQEQIRKQMQLEYAIMSADARGRAAISIFRSLDQKAQKKIIEYEKNRDIQDEKD